MRNFRGSLQYVPPVSPITGCMIDYATNYNPNATIPGSCTFPDNENKIIIVESSPGNIETHGIYVQQGVDEGYGSAYPNTVLSGKGITYGLQYANDTNFKALLYSYIGAGGLVSSFIPLYPQTQAFMPLGSNDPVELMTPSTMTVIITCGAGDTHNITGYGMGLEFWDNENVGSVNIHSSFSNGVIAGKMLRIKEAAFTKWNIDSWWMARYIARLTADRNEARRPANTLWTDLDGFGKINLTSALDFISNASPMWPIVLPPDPFINGGNVYTPYEP